MAHEIDMTTGKAAAMFAGKAAWHRLGTVVADAQTSDDAISLAGLDWEVNQYPVFAELNGERIDSDDHFMNVRSDTKACLGIVGGQYQVWQNREAFAFMDHIVGEKLAMFETAGSLKGGRQVWMLARIPGELRAAGDDVVHPYMLVTNSHDGTSALRVMTTTVRVVCWNTLSLALRTATNSGITIRHCLSLDDRVAEARRSMSIVARQIDQFSGEMQALASRQVTREQLAEYFAAIVDGQTKSDKSAKKGIEQLKACWEDETNQLPEIRGTWWAAYNAVSHWTDHSRGRMVSDESRFRSNLMGASHDIKTTAWTRALAAI